MHKAPEGQGIAFDSGRRIRHYQGMTARTAYISLGGNSGNEEDLFARALQAIEKRHGVKVAGVSSLYCTEPWGDRDQPWFCNQVAALECDAAVTPQSLLDAMLRLETELGRTRDVGRRFGPRVIDLDLLLFADIVCVEPEVTVPHPRMTERAFVLVPLLEIAPGILMPDGVPVASHLALLRYRVEGTAIFQEENAAGRKG